MLTKKRSHKNSVRRLTARERAVAWMDRFGGGNPNAEVRERRIRTMVRMLGAHARATLAREKRRHAIAWDRMLAKGAGK